MLPPLQLDRDNADVALSVQPDLYQSTLDRRVLRRAYNTQLAQAFASYETACRFAWDGRVFDASKPLLYSVPIVLDIHNYPVAFDEEEYDLFLSTRTDIAVAALKEYQARVAGLEAELKGQMP